MSLKGNAENNYVLRGKIHKLNTLQGYSAYEVAVINGFKGTEEEWLASLKATTREVRIGEVTLYGDRWMGNDNPYYQVVELDVTNNSQVDLTPSVEQLAIFYDKSLAFVAENDGGMVTVYAIGQKPENDYTIQVTITEVDV